MAQVHLRGVKKTYDNKIEVIHGIDMEIADDDDEFAVDNLHVDAVDDLELLVGLAHATQMDLRHRLLLRLATFPSRPGRARTGAA